MRPLAPNAVQLELESADGDGGYPGQLNAHVLYKLEGPRLTIVWCQVVKLKYF
jgi:galactose mutarotase-like enzyme